MRYISKNWEAFYHINDNIKKNSELKYRALLIETDIYASS